MNVTHPARPRRARVPALALALAALFAACGAGPSLAQLTKPWVPPGETLLGDVTTARMRFMRQLGDSVGGDNFLPYDDVGRMARRLLRSLGREHFLQAPAIEATLDSLGLDTEVVVDPALPSVVLVLVRNPFRVSSDAVGFLFWHVRDDLRMQGVGFPPARAPQLRTWHTGRQSAPYQACVLYSGRGPGAGPGMKLFRMSPDGRFWNLVQYEGNAPEFGPRARVSFVDANLDGLPEILAYHPVDDDTFFVLRSGVPPIVNEFLFTERPQGFVLHNARTVPGPVETLRLFAARMAAKDFDWAKRYLLEPARISEAVAAGWPKLAGRGAWTVEYGEQDQPWPEWLAVRTNDAGGPKRWIFHFTLDEGGHWLIRRWLPVVPSEAPGATPPGGAAADTTRGRRP